MRITKLCIKRGQITVFKRQTQPHLDFNKFRWLGPKIWALIPNGLKSIKSLKVFKEKLKDLTFGKYVDGVGYID